LRINKYRIEKIRKELASEECEYLENAGSGHRAGRSVGGEVPPGNCEKKENRKENNSQWR
jgi:hypothetical protein